MAYPVYLYKEFENEEVVIYKFCIEHKDENPGRIELNKNTKMIQELTSISNVSDGLSQWVFNRAGLRISQCYREGTFPDKMEIIH
ncbi:hypothetical protein [Chengkuizengella sediminis]|uniref:hypothetical protein n=1 Tax=Chengkuizengella sediminis TaxID=1885917 RepID=UPI0013893E17|nr:hypothetical protein [Chengkuizengella sediminis]NDI37256.1 hypothetical protein [Chengkuizengella sediminis]